jgi:hypothetical protein
MREKLPPTLPLLANGPVPARNRERARANLDRVTSDSLLTSIAIAGQPGARWSLGISRRMAVVMLFACVVAMSLAIDAYWAGVSELFITAWIVLFNITLVLALSSASQLQIRSAVHLVPVGTPEQPWKSAALPPPFRPPRR